jgi:hypothetical protein
VSFCNERWYLYCWEMECRKWKGNGLRAGAAVSKCGVVKCSMRRGKEKFRTVGIRGDREIVSEWMGQ